LAARWIGKFHAAIMKKPAKQGLAFLNHYDASYYLGWARRTCQFAGELHRQFPWLARLCQRAEEVLAPLSAAPPTVIHGEYYQNNILIRERIVYPSDWESAAIAPGEIDLAALTEGSWAAEIVQQCKQEYQQARWPSGAPDEFESRLTAARLYLHFRWLGERHEWTTRKDARWRFAELRRAADGMGIIRTTGQGCPERIRIAPGPRATQRSRRVY